MTDYSPPSPPNTVALGAGEKQRYWKNSGKGIHIYNREKDYLGLEMSGSIKGMRLTEGRYRRGGGAVITNILNCLASAFALKLLNHRLNMGV